jgi:hypothetical protein
VADWAPEAIDEGTLVSSVALVTVAECKSWLGYRNPTQPNREDPLLTNIVASACDYLEQIAGPIAPTTFVERYDGWAGSTLMLRHDPVISVNYVNEYWSTGGLHVLTESTPADTIDGYQLEHETGRLVRVFQGNWPRTWFPGSMNVEVSYVAGRNPIPPIAKFTAFELVQHWWQQLHQQSAQGFGGQIDPEAEATTDQQAGAWLGVPKSVVDKIRLLRQPVLG